MRKVVIIGNNVYAQMMKRYIVSTEFAYVVAYAVDEQFRKDKILDGIPVYSYSELKKTYSGDEIELIMGIGYKQMGKIRKKEYIYCKSMGYSFANYIHPSAVIASDVKMGEGNNILESVIIEIGVTLGDCNLFFGGSVVGHESCVGSFNTLSIKAATAGCVTIGDHAFLGVNCGTKDHIVIEDYVLIGATAYAFKNIEKGKVVVPSKSVVLEGKCSFDYL